MDAAAAGAVENQAVVEGSKPSGPRLGQLDQYGGTSRPTPRRTSPIPSSAGARR